MVQLNDCTCLGYAQIFECTAFGAGATVWSGTFFDCQDGTSRNEIRLRHSQYGDVESPPHGECNHGAVIANSIGSADNHCYTSQHIVTIGKEMINETIECSHDDLKGRVTVIGQKSLMVTETPYPPPTNIHIESNDSRQITFAWDEVSAQCSSLQYIITAINCGLCPNITADKNVTCDIQSGIRLRTNNACMFAVQTEICGDLLGERSDYVVVHMDGEQYLFHTHCHKKQTYIIMCAMLL